MTPTQLLTIKGEFEKEFGELFAKETVSHWDGEYTKYIPLDNNIWQFIESKLKAVEIRRGLENFKIAMEEIEKARGEATGKDWYVQDDELVVKKGSYVIYRIDLKPDNDEPSWRCGKCEQEEMMAKGIAIPCPIPEHSIRCSLRDKSNKLKNKDENTK